MKIRKYGRNFAPLYFADGEGDEGGEGGGGGGATTASFSQADIDKAVSEAVAGLKDKNNELLGNVKELKKGLTAWEGLDPEQVRGMIKQFETDEVLKLHAEGKHDEAYDKRMERERAEHQSALEGVSNQLNEANSVREKLENQVRDLIIDQQVLSSFMQEKGLETAAPDVVLRAKAAFKIEDGVAIARNDKGEIIRGKDGPITIQEWVQSLKTSAAHLFPGSQGAGAGGSGGSGGSGNIDAQMEAAANAGNMAEYRRLRSQKNKAAAGND